MTHNAEKDAPFLSVPSGLDIAHYFVEETDHRNPGYDGISLWREDRDYSYVWMESFVDLDMWHAYLLDVRTNIGTPHGEIGESRDYLYVFHGAGGRFDVEWHNQPIDFGAETDAHWSRFEKGMAWFASRIEKSVEDADATRVTSPGASLAPTDEGDTR